MISRKALLVSAPAGELPARENNDLETTRNFLLSPRGGAWASHEIHVIDNPTVEELTAAVDATEADYTITYFSGRSFGDSAGNRFLVLRGDFIRDTELLNNSAKQLVLVDTCPDFFSSEVIHFVAKPNEFELARQMYDKWIEKCEAGQVIMHAADSSQPSQGSGAFTQTLLQVAGRVPSIENKFNLRSIHAAGNGLPGPGQDETPAVMPLISFRRGNIKLPFAMALPAPRLGLPAANAGSSGMNTLSVMLFLLGFLLSSD